MPLTRGACAVAMLLCVALIAACGGEDQPKQSEGAGLTRFHALVAELARAAPQGQTTDRESAKVARLQATITTRYADALPAGACRTALEAVSSSYTAYARAATTHAAGGTNTEAYGTAAGAVSTAMAAAERACR